MEEKNLCFGKYVEMALATYISFLLSVMYVNGGSPSRCFSVSMVSHSSMLSVGKKVSASYERCTRVR